MAHNSQKKIMLFFLRMENVLSIPQKIRNNDLGENSVLRKLYLNELKTIYWVEKQMLKLFPKLIRSATTRYLKACFKGHFSATIQHVKRVEEVFALLDQKKIGKKCALISKIIIEAKDGIKATPKNTLARDLELINVAQKFERYETNAYRKLTRFANIFGYGQAELIFQEILTEELEAEETFVAIEEDTLNDEMFKSKSEATKENEDEFEAAEEE